MNPSHVASEVAEPPARKPRYAYASGSRPLVGYTIKRGVGRGGFGEVYFAVSDAGKEVALKLIRRNLEVELRGVTHCLNLKHPNLIDLYDIRVDENDDRWVVMEYVSGASLDDVIARYPEGMPVDMALHWFSGICAAVDYLHDHGIVHRDLKPGNIFLDHERVKVGDYGLSKFISCSRRSGQTESVGTVHYMAPEIANGRYGKEIDTYALGIILYEMLTGKVPFEGESIGEVLMKHLTAEPDLQKLAEPFRGIVRQAMAKDPELRFQNVREMVALLEARMPASDGSFEPVAPVAFAGPTFDVPSFPAGGPSAFPPSPSDGFDEPIAAGFHRVAHGSAKALGFFRWPPLARALAGFLCVAVLLRNFNEGMRIVVGLAITYAVYRALRAMLIAMRSGTATSHRMGQPRVPLTYASSLASATPVAHPPQPGASSSASPFGGYAMPQGRKKGESVDQSPEKIRRPWRRRETSNWHVLVQEHLASRTWHQRLSETTWALLISSIVAAVGAGLFCVWGQGGFLPSLALWMWLVTTIASWAIIVPAKLVEGRIEDQAPLRFIHFLSGAGVGCAAWGLATILLLQLPTHNEAPRIQDAVFSRVWRDEAASEYPLAMYVAWFAVLFLLLGWSRQTELARAARVSLWAVAWSALVAFVITFFWWFPQPVGLSLAGILSLAVQLASPWMPPSQRRKLAESSV